MEFTSIAELTASTGAAIGGWELIKYMLNIRSNKRKERAEADKTMVEHIQTCIKNGWAEKDGIDYHKLVHGEEE